MNLIEAIKRLRFTFSKQNKPNNIDADALSILLFNLNNLQKDRIEDNRVFAKLLCILIKEKYSNGNNDINQTLKFISQDLKEPLEFHIETLSNKITSTQIVNFIKTLTIDVPESEFSDPIALANRENQFWDVHQKQILNEIIFSNSLEQTRDNFFMTANEILNNDNYRL